MVHKYSTNYRKNAKTMNNIKQNVLIFPLNTFCLGLQAFSHIFTAARKTFLIKKYFYKLCELFIFSWNYDIKAVYRHEMPQASVNFKAIGFRMLTVCFWDISLINLPWNIFTLKMSTAGQLKCKAGKHGVWLICIKYIKGEKNSLVFVAAVVELSAKSQRGRRIEIQQEQLALGGFGLIAEDSTTATMPLTTSKGAVGKEAWHGGGRDQAKVAGRTCKPHKNNSTVCFVYLCCVVFFL